MSEYSQSVEIRNATCNTYPI